MKKRFIQICSLLGLVIGLMVSAQAQSVRRFEASIPFDFYVGNKVFTAGDYAFGLTNQLAYQESLTIRDLKSGKSQSVLINREQANELSENSQLLFNRYEDSYFLAAITTPTLSAKFLKAKTESRLAKAKTVKRETIALKK
jgi:hypothetical protein